MKKLKEKDLKYIYGGTLGINVFFSKFGKGSSGGGGFSGKW